MNARRFSTLLLLGSIAGILMIASGALDVRVQLKHNNAGAFDLFRGDDEEKES